MKRRVRLWKKLKQRSGESLGEVLIAVLISAVALVMLASMLTASSSLIENSKDRMAQYYTGQEALAQYSGTPFEGTVTISDGSAEGLNETVSVECFRREAPNGAEIVAYRLPQSNVQEGGDEP